MEHAKGAGPALSADPPAELVGQRVVGHSACQHCIGDVRVCGSLSGAKLHGPLDGCIGLCSSCTVSMGLANGRPEQGRVSVCTAGCQRHCFRPSTPGSCSTTDHLANSGHRMPTHLCTAVQPTTHITGIADIANGVREPPTHHAKHPTVRTSIDHQRGQHRPRAWPSSTC